MFSLHARSSRLLSFSATIVVEEDWFSRVTMVYGSTYPIRYELILMGFKWNRKRRCWLKRGLEGDSVASVLRRYGCVLAGSSSGFEIGEDMVYEARWVCPWRSGRM